MDPLAQELFDAILSHLPSKDLFQFRLVSRRYRNRSFSFFANKHFAVLKQEFTHQGLLKLVEISESDVFRPLIKTLVLQPPASLTIYANAMTEERIQRDHDRTYRRLQGVCSGWYASLLIKAFRNLKKLRTLCYGTHYDEKELREAMPRFGRNILPMAIVDPFWSLITIALMIAIGISKIRIENLAIGCQQTMFLVSDLGVLSHAMPGMKESLKSLKVLSLQFVTRIVYHHPIVQTNALKSLLQCTPNIATLQLTLLAAELPAPGRDPVRLPEGIILPFLKTLRISGRGIFDNGPNLAPFIYGFRSIRYLSLGPIALIHDYWKQLFSMVTSRLRLLSLEIADLTYFIDENWHRMEGKYGSPPITLAVRPGDEKRIGYDADRNEFYYVTDPDSMYFWTYP